MRARASLPTWALEGLAPIFAEAGVETLPRVRRAVFAGTDKGVAEAMHGEGLPEIVGLPVSSLLKVVCCARVE